MATEITSELRDARVKPLSRPIVPILALAAFVLAVAGLLAGRATFGTSPELASRDRAATSEPTASQFPTPTSTLDPVADRSRFGWEVPYLEYDRQAPKFHGEINGLQLGVRSGPLPSCANPLADPDWKLAATGTPFDLHLEALPAGVSVWGEPRIGRCADDGRILWIETLFEVRGGGLVQVSRGTGVRWYGQEFVAERVTTGTIASRPAVFADVGPSRIGQTAVVVVDEEIAGSTMIISSNVNLADLKTIARAMYP